VNEHDPPELLVECGILDHPEKGRGAGAGAEQIQAPAGVQGLQ
jgi:hypothetical protein